MITIAPPIGQNLNYRQKSSFCGTFVKTFFNYKCSTKESKDPQNSLLEKTFYNVFQQMFHKFQSVVLAIAIDFFP